MKFTIVLSSDLHGVETFSYFSAKSAIEAMDRLLKLCRRAYNGPQWD